MSKRKAERRGAEEENPKPKRKKKERKKASSKHGNDLKVRTVSQLAELVTSGAVSVPKSLVEYVEDRVQLLDQMFTILSPSDIKGMLPDILKGLKMKQVKQLCSELLNTMTSKEIIDIIEANTASEESAKMSPISQGKCQQQLASPSLPDTKSISQVSPKPPKTKSIEKDSLFSSSMHHGKPPITTVEESHVHMKEAAVAANTCKSSPSDEDEIVINISDVSDMEDSIDRETGGREQLQDAISPEQSISDTSSSSDYVYEDCDFREIQEQNQILEMELRRRALEAELKRINKVDAPSSLDSDNQSQATNESMEYVNAECADSKVQTRDDVVEMDFGTVLEMKLREKALQSLLAKQKKTQ